ncbi:MAG: FAD-binding protein [Bacteroidales bacterium]|nr:FAD-binding protein [Bacteroidales bacterium]
MIKTEYYKDLTKMNTFGMKVKARCFMEYDSVADLVDIEFAELARPVLHIGGGSNLLFTDDFKGTVLHSKINFIEILDECHSKCHFRTNGTSSEDVDSSDSGHENAPEVVLVSVGAGVVFDDFCDWAAKEGLWGVENLSYIPGEVGASAVQNIGAYGVEVKDVIHRVYCYDTVEEEFVSFSVEECGYGYRDSIFKNPEVKGRYVVTHVVFALSREPRPRLDYGHLRDAVLSALPADSITETESLPSRGDGPLPFMRPRSATVSADAAQQVKPTIEGTPTHSDTSSDCNFDRTQRVEKSITPALIRKVIIRIRKEKLPEPSVVGSAGSFFKNPVVSAEHFARIEAAAKAEHGADYNVPHYIIMPECQCVPETPSHSVGPSPYPGVGKCLLHTNDTSAGRGDYSVKVPAAWMIEQCGWKGRRSGGAAVWEKQPLVIVNYTGEAYPEEIVGLEKRIIASVKSKFDVELHPEVEHV